MKRINPVLVCTLLIGLLFCQAVHSETVKLASVFSDHMVLQRDKPVRIWGWAGADETVVVQFAGQEVRATAAKDGRWVAVLQPLKTSTAGRSMEISSGTGETTTLSDVLVGEVWICSGQSNMEWPLHNNIAGSKEAIATATFPNLRLFHLQRKVSLQPEADCTGTWTRCTPDTARNFSATAFFFGRKLINELEDVPVGLVMTAWGGTPAEAWTSLEALETIESMKGAVAQTRAKSDLAPDGYDEEIARWQKSLVAAVGNSEWLAQDFQDGPWPQMSNPAKWSDSPLKGFAGAATFRKTIDIPESWAGTKLVLELGAIDDMDVTAFNGKVVGTTGAWNIPRKYEIPADLVKAGKAVVAVHAINPHGEGGFIGSGNQLKIYPIDQADKAIPLAGSWKYQKGGKAEGLPQKPADPKGVNSHTPASLYNGMIHPLVPLAVRGAIWYQGESNSRNPKPYREIFPAMVKNWRASFGQGDFPFYYVQIAPFRYAAGQGGVDIREIQRECLHLIPNSGMACIMDKTTLRNIHPPYKTEVGERLAYWALAKQYGKEIVYSGPLFTSHTVEDGKIRVRFEYAQGLTSQGQALTRFEVAGNDGQWVKAEAKINGKTIVVSSPEVASPKHVRYGWHNEATAELWNAAGLPASSFRSDDW